MREVMHMHRARRDGGEERAVDGECERSYGRIVGIKGLGYLACVRFEDMDLLATNEDDSIASVLAHERGRRFW